MKYAAHWLAAFAVTSGSLLCCASDALSGELVRHDTSPHTIQFIMVENNVKLEVLDWGGSGRPMVLLTGYGNDGRSVFMPVAVEEANGVAGAKPADRGKMVSFGARQYHRTGLQWQVDVKSFGHSCYNSPPARSRRGVHLQDWHL